MKRNQRYQDAKGPNRNDTAVEGYTGVYETPSCLFYGIKDDGGRTAFYAHPQGAKNALIRPNDLARRIIASGPRLG